MEHKSSEVPLHENGMVTVHIREFDGYPWSVNSDVKQFLQFFVGKEHNSESEKEDDRHKYFKMQELVKELYNAALKDDPKWHFFYEPEIIVRISSKEVLQKVEELLTKKGAKFDVYPYPIPPKQQQQKQYGETEGGIVLAYFDLFVSIFHTHAVAAVIMNDNEHFEYMERVIHTMFNPRLYTRQEEGEHLATLAIYKSGSAGVLDFVMNGKR